MSFIEYKKGEASKKFYLKKNKKTPQKRYFCGLGYKLRIYLFNNIFS